MATALHLLRLFGRPYVASYFDVSRAIFHPAPLDGVVEAGLLQGGGGDGGDLTSEERQVTAEVRKDQVEVDEGEVSGTNRRSASLVSPFSEGARTPQRGPLRSSLRTPWRSEPAKEHVMRRTHPLIAAAVAALVLIGPAMGCSDDPGEDRIGDGEINDEGD